MDPTTRPHMPRWSALGLVTIGSWLAVLGTWFLQNVLFSWLWILGIGVLFIGGGLSACLTLAWGVRSALRGRLLAALLISVPPVVIALIVLTVPWGDVYSRVWFALHHDAFVRAEELVRSGELDPTVDYYGVVLPDDLAGISISGRISATSDWDDLPGPCSEPIEFAPALIGIPDGAIGFVHLPCDAPPRGFYVNGYDDGMVPRIALGDGWWWADGVVPDGYDDGTGD